MAKIKPVSSHVDSQSDGGMPGASEETKRAAPNMARREAVAGSGLPAAEWLTMERLLWGGILLLAAVLRLWDLGSVPLQAGEAAKALTSWKVMQAAGGDAAAGPLLIYGNALVFLAFGANDASARLLPALAGVAVVGLPFLLRRQVGRQGALAAAVLLAISPTLIYFSRLVDSQSLTAAAALGTVACLARLGTGGGRRWLDAAAVALGLLVLAGQGAYTTLLVLAGAAAVVGLRRPGQAGAAAGAPIALEATALRRAALVAGGIVVLGTTALLTNLHGVQDGLVNPLADWLLTLRGADQPWYLQLQTLLIYEPVLLIFGLVGAFAALRGGSGLSRFLVWWAAAAFVLSTLSRERPGAGIVLVLVPLALLAGPAVVRIGRELWSAVPRQELAVYMGATLSLFVLFWIVTLFFTTPGQALPEIAPLGPFKISTGWLGDTAIPTQMTLLVAAILGLGLWIGGRYLPGLVAALAVTVLIAATFHAAVLLNYAAYASPVELPVAGRTSPDVRTLARDIGDAEDALAFGNRPRAVYVATQDADLLGWYLREHPGVRFGGHPQASDGLIIATADAETPPGKFAAQRYRLQEAWTGSIEGTDRFWRWLTLREPPGEVTHEDVVLYIRVP